MAKKTRRELQMDFLAGITFNARRFNMQKVGVPSLDKQAKNLWPNVQRLDEGIIYREEYVPMPKLEIVRDPEQIAYLNKMNDSHDKPNNREANPGDNASGGGAVGN